MNANANSADSPDDSDDPLAHCGRLVEFYRPDQPRDNYGRWVGPGGTAGPAPARPGGGGAQPPGPGRPPRNFQEFRRLLTPRVRALPNYIGQTVACTPAFYAAVARTLNTVDDDYHDFLSREGRTILLGDNLAVMDPALKGKRPQGWPQGSTWAEAAGAYDPVRRRVMLPEWVADPAGVFHANGTIAAATREEIAHALDHALDQRTPQRGASDSDPQFLAAYRADERAVTDPAVRIRLAYFLQSGAAGRRELFAQLFVIMGGAGLVPAPVEADLRTYFPNSLRVLPTILP